MYRFVLPTVIERGSPARAPAVMYSSGGKRRRLAERGRSFGVLASMMARVCPSTLELVLGGCDGPRRRTSESER